MRRFGLLVFLASMVTTQDAAVKPVASVQQIMDAMVIPSSNALFNVAREAPANGDEWAAVENGAVILAESGNLLLIGGRARDADVWVSSSKAMVEAGEVALEAAEARDVEAILEAGNQVVDSCETCHERYLDRAR